MEPTDNFTEKILDNIKNNTQWMIFYHKFINDCCVYEQNDNKYYECLGFNFDINADSNFAVMPYNAFHKKEKSDAMWNWYLTGDKYNDSILKWFSEYERCRDSNHDYFNSNYGQYIFKDKRLSRVIEELLQNPMTRHALMFINSDENQTSKEIDKLCTNCFQFYIRDNKLHMVIQMRASNIITLLPYDNDCFHKVYMIVYEQTKKKYIELETGFMHYQISSAHFYESNLEKIE